MLMDNENSVHPLFGLHPQMAFEWAAADECHRIPIMPFDFSSLDMLRDQLAECRTDAELAQVLDRWCAHKIAEARTAVIIELIAWLWPKTKPYLALRQLASAANLTILAGKTDVELAKECGVSKENFQLGKEEVCKKLGLRKTRTQRSDEGRRNMKLRNFRRLTECPPTS